MTIYAYVFISICAHFKSAPAVPFPSAPPGLGCTHSLSASETWRAHLIFKIFLLNFWPQAQAGKAAGFCSLFTNEFSDLTATGHHCKSSGSPPVLRGFPQAPPPIVQQGQQMRGRGGKWQNSPRQERHKLPLFLPRVQQDFMNKCFTICCLLLSFFPQPWNGCLGEFSLVVFMGENLSSPLCIPRNPASCSLQWALGFSSVHFGLFLPTPVLVSLGQGTKFWGAERPLKRTQDASPQIQARVTLPDSNWLKQFRRLGGSSEAMLPLVQI